MQMSHGRDLVGTHWLALAINVIALLSLSWPLSGIWWKTKCSMHPIHSEPYPMSFWYKSCCHIVSSHSIKHCFDTCIESSERAAIAWHMICMVVSSQKVRRQCRVWRCFQIHILDAHGTLTSLVKKLTKAAIQNRRVTRLDKSEIAPGLQSPLICLLCWFHAPHRATKQKIIWAVPKICHLLIFQAYQNHRIPIPKTWGCSNTRGTQALNLWNL